MTIFCILCGGTGSRLWPKSREKLPKQFLKITNENTMLQNTIIRVNKIIEKEDCKSHKIIIICNQEHNYLAKQQIQELNIKSDTIIISEPKGRDSAPAICLASLMGTIEDNTFIMPCDHVMNDNVLADLYIESLNYIENSIITFGIKPTYPETGYGYIKTDENLNTIKFIEKPNFEMANKYFEEGSYLWNAGIFLFKNKNILKCFEKYDPEILTICKNVVDKMNKKTDMILLDPLFTNCRSISIDYAIMERLCNDIEIGIDRKTFTYSSKWSDIGSFNSLYEELEKDEYNNVQQGDIKILNTTNCYIESDNKLITTIGLNDLIIVDTLDALLVCNKNNVQDVKKMVNMLKENKRDEIILHKNVFRPWGYYKTIEGNDTSGFKAKKIVVFPNKKLSLQSHNHRSEHWVITSGCAKVTLGTEELYLNKNDYVYIPVNTLHRIENIGDKLLEFIETQIGNYLGEDDIIRYEDDFGRA